MVNVWASLLGSYLGLLGGILRVIVSKSLAVGKLSASRAGLAPWEAGPHGGGGGGGGVGCGGRKRSLGICMSGPARDTGFLHGLLTSMQVPKVPQDPDR